MTKNEKSRLLSYAAAILVQPKRCQQLQKIALAGQIEIPLSMEYTIAVMAITHAASITNSRDELLIAIEQNGNNYAIAAVKFAISNKKSYDDFHKLGG